MAIGMNAGKQLAFTAFALYMSGNSLHIFSIFALGMAIMSPINGLMGFSNAFARYSDSNVNLIMPKVLYVLSQLGGILLVLYKFNNLGLLPNSPIDLISSLPPPIVRLSLNDPHHSFLRPLSPRSHSLAPRFSCVLPPSPILCTSPPSLPLAHFSQGSNVLAARIRSENLSIHASFHHFEQFSRLLSSPFFA
jgi:hypothetical protein